MLKSIRKFMKRFAGPNPFKVNNWNSNSNSSNSNSNSPRRRKTPSPRKKTIRRKSV